MQMKYRLLRRLATGIENIYARIAAIFNVMTAYLLHRRRYRLQIVRTAVENVDAMLLGDNERMSHTVAGYIQKGVRIFVFVNFVRRDFSLYNFAEKYNRSYYFSFGAVQIRLRYFYVNYTVYLYVARKIYPQILFGIPFEKAFALTFGKYRNMLTDKAFGEFFL